MQLSPGQYLASLDPEVAPLVLTRSAASQNGLRLGGGPTLPTRASEGSRCFPAGVFPLPGLEVGYLQFAFPILFSLFLTC